MSFVKPTGEDNEHPGYASTNAGESHLVNLIKAVENGPDAKNTQILVTYDETEKAARLRNRRAHIPTSNDLPEIDRQAQRAHKQGADFISLRRLSELLGATTLDAFAALSTLLETRRPDHYQPSLYQTH